MQGNRTVKWAGVLFFAVVALAAGCDRIEEPWLRHPDQYENEQVLAEEVNQALDLRLHRVQTDR
jgi:hypothetical protein